MSKNKIFFRFFVEYIIKIFTFLDAEYIIKIFTFLDAVFIEFFIKYILSEIVDRDANFPY